MDAKEIAHRLRDRCLSVCEHLCPGGKREGPEYVFDPGHGKIKVVLKGAKAGVFNHWGAGDEPHSKGDLLDLWAYMQGCSVSQALKEAADYLGIEAPQFRGQKAKSYKRPDPAKMDKKPALPGTAVDRYLRGERGLTKDTIKAFQIMEGAAWKRGDKRITGPWIMFPFLRPGKDGRELTNIKWLHVDRTPEGKKLIFQEAEAEPGLFGWHLIPDTARVVCITEGEIDAMTVHQWGLMPALSVPAGAGAGGKHQWIETDYDRLARFDEIFICMDMDSEGAVAVADIVKRLGIHRCRIVQLPHKDANECLAQHGMTAADAGHYFGEAKHLEPAELKRAGAFTEEVIEAFYPTEKGAIGIALPWKKASELRLRMGEVSIWIGVNGHGKSSLLGQVVLYGASDERACIASLEVRAPETLKLYTQKLARTGSPSVEMIRACTDWMDGRIWIYDRTGRADRDRLLEVFTYARRRYGIRLFVIDSLMRCGIAEDDYNTQADFVDSLVDWSMAEGGHICLVAHPTKPKDEKSPVTRLDMRGAGKMTDLAHVCCTFWRNVPKERKMEEIRDNEKYSDLDRAGKLEDQRKKPDNVLIVEKQRAGTRWTGAVRLWRDAESDSWADWRGAAAPTIEGAPETDRDLAF